MVLGRNDNPETSALPVVGPTGRSASPPIVKDKDVRTVEPGLVVALHSDALKVGAKASRQEMAIRRVESQVYSRDQASGFLFDRERFAGVEQPIEVRFRGRSWPHRAELDETAIRIGFARRPHVADGKSGQTRASPNQNSIPEALLRDGPDLESNVQTLEAAVGDRTARFQAAIAFARGQLRVARPGSRTG